MAMLYRKDIFDKHGITPPATWAEFADAAKKLHAADPNVFLTDALLSNGGWVNGLLWPMGWKPISRDGDKLAININDKISKDFAAYWQDLITAGVVETKPGFNNEWYTGLDSGRYATWLTAGWGPVFLTSVAKTSAGQWRAADLPQWDASKFATGNWGGSTYAVTKQSKYPDAALLFAAWVNSSQQGIRWNVLPTPKGGRGVWPVDKYALEDEQLVKQPDPVMGGQRAGTIYAAASRAVDTSFQWSPWTVYFEDRYNAEAGKAVKGQETWDQALANMQAAVTQFAQQQGYTVTH